METSVKLTFPELLEESFRKHHQRTALGFVDGASKTYQQVRTDIYTLVSHLESLGIQPGDRIALLGPNAPNWVVSYLAATFMGAVAVPLLPDFTAEEIVNILDHSESKAIIISEKFQSKINGYESDFLKVRLRMENFAVEQSNTSFSDVAVTEQRYQVNEEDLAAIIYTSGTTGKSKGVMLSHKNICVNVRQAGIVQSVHEKDRFLSVLPLSHTYENTLGLILPLVNGASIFYLQKAPTPAVLLPALEKVKPTIMLTVPLIIEKIFRNRILPTITEKWYAHVLYQVPAIRKGFHLLAGKKLMNMFGGSLQFFGIGGAKLDKVVERFLIEAKFPYAIGYGLTETAPLLAGVNPSNTRLQSTGPSVDGLQMELRNKNKSGIGEIWVRGDNVMKGYYKEPELTKEVLTSDGWFNTGDLGKLDKDNFLYIRGRHKNMIVGANGKNIYPEEIESVINNFKHVVESIVIEKKGKLVALVHFNREELEKKYKHLREEVTHYVEKTTDDLRQELQVYINSKVNKYSQIHKVIVQPAPFQKTATQKIKRFLYR
jgi:long-chain acyl-CoA synthetase